MQVPMTVCPAFVDEEGYLLGGPEAQPEDGVGALVVPDPATITNSLYRINCNFSSDPQAGRCLLLLR